MSRKRLNSPWEILLPHQIAAPFKQHPRWKYVAYKWGLESCEQQGTETRIFAPGWELDTEICPGGNWLLFDDEGRVRAEIYPKRGCEPGLTALRPRYRIIQCLEGKNERTSYVRCFYAVHDTGVVPNETLWEGPGISWWEGKTITCERHCGLFLHPGGTSWMMTEYKEACAFLNSDRRKFRNWRNALANWSN